MAAFSHPSDGHSILFIERQSMNNDSNCSLIDLPDCVDDVGSIRWQSTICESNRNF